jgi:hypothetical protein
LTSWLIFSSCIYWLEKRQKKKRTLFWIFSFAVVFRRLRHFIGYFLCFESIIDLIFSYSDNVGLKYFSFYELTSVQLKRIVAMYLYMHCACIIFLLANSHFILQIHHAKCFKMRLNTYLYLSFSSRYCYKRLKSYYPFKWNRLYVNLHVGIASLCIWTLDKLQFFLLSTYSRIYQLLKLYHACFQHFARHFQRQQEEEMKNSGYVAAKEVGNGTQCTEVQFASFLSMETGKTHLYAVE